MRKKYTQELSFEERFKDRMENLGKDGVIGIIKTAENPINFGEMDDWNRLYNSPKNFKKYESPTYISRKKEGGCKLGQNGMMIMNGNNYSGGFSRPQNVKYLMPNSFSPQIIHNKEVLSSPYMPSSMPMQLNPNSIYRSSYMSSPYPLYATPVIPQNSLSLTPYSYSSRSKIDMTSSAKKNPIIRSHTLTLSTPNPSSFIGTRKKNYSSIEVSKAIITESPVLKPGGVRGDFDPISEIQIPIRKISKNKRKSSDTGKQGNKFMVNNFSEQRELYHKKISEKKEKILK